MILVLFFALSGCMRFKTLYAFTAPYSLGIKSIANGIAHSENLLLLWNWRPQASQPPTHSLAPDLLEKVHKNSFDVIVDWERTVDAFRLAPLILSGHNVSMMRLKASTVERSWHIEGFNAGHNRVLLLNCSRGRCSINQFIASPTLENLYSFHAHALSGTLIITASETFWKYLSAEVVARICERHGDDLERLRTELTITACDRALEKCEVRHELRRSEFMLAFATLRGRFALSVSQVLA